MPHYNTPKDSQKEAITLTLPLGWGEAAFEALVRKPYRGAFRRGPGEDLKGF
jgi:hypothetical protein